MGRHAVLLLAVVVVGCGQSPSPRDPGPSRRAAGPKTGLTKGADNKKEKDQDRTEQASKTEKKPVAGPPTEKEVRTAAVQFLGQPGGKIKDVEVTFVSGPLDVPPSKRDQLASPSTKDVKAYYVDFTATNLVLNEKLESRHYLLIVGREGDDVKVLATYDNTRTIEQQMGKDWFTKNPPPQKTGSP
jgi:hypothetical protein